MGSKKKRREAAQRKTKRRKITLLAVCVAFLVVYTVAVIVYHATRPDSRVFAVAGNQSVTLYENGRFTARLAHNVNLSGTFTEEVHGDVITISFTQGGGTVSTQIENDVLLLPDPWRATCEFHRHETEFPLRR